jgi:hypothetical protein
MIALNDFKKEIELKKAKLYISFPGTQEGTFNLLRKNINEVHGKLQQAQFKLLGHPNNYIFADSMIFNAAYHLTENGAKQRTLQLIKDLKKENLIH